MSEGLSLLPYLGEQPIAPVSEVIDPFSEAVGKTFSEAFEGVDSEDSGSWAQK